MRMSRAEAGASGGQERSEAIAEFCSVTSGSPEQAGFYLEASNGQFDRAVSMYFEQEAGRDEGADSFPVAQNTYEQSEGRQQYPEPAWRRHRNLLGVLFGVPRTVLQTGFAAIFGTLRLVGLFGANVLPAPMIHSIQGRLQSLSEGRNADPQAAASTLHQDLQQRYGSDGPQWLTTSWSEAARRAHTQFRFLFVYLHSPSHQDTESFCRETLYDSAVADYVNSNFVCWAGNILYPDAFQLSQGLRVRAYPYVGLLAFSGSRTRLIAAAEGHFPADALLPVLQNAQEQQAIHLVAEQAEQNERDYTRRLREEQDAEYQRSLEMDKERERQRLAASAAEADARREAQEAADRERAAAESERRRHNDRRSGIEIRRQQKRANLGSEPQQTASGVVHVRVRLPDGTHHQRRFLSSELLQKAYDFVDSLEALSTLKYSLASSYPRRVFSGSALQQSFSDLGLTPQAMLFVQPEDDD